MESLSDPGFVAALFAVLVKKLGGEVQINQADFDDIAYSFMEEHHTTDGAIVFKLMDKRSH